MSIKLFQALPDDLPEIVSLYRQVVDKMQQSGNKQWVWETYPSTRLLERDMEFGQLYIARDKDGTLLVSVCINEEQEPEYDAVNWLFGTRPGLFHRLAIAPGHQGQGLGKQAIAFVEQLLTDRGCDSLRCDTFTDNVAALSLYDKNGMRRSGTVCYPGYVKPFVCFEKPLAVTCPLLPLKMHPACRGGALTPWGGQKLCAEYGKASPALPLGESLEVSCLPGLESTDDMGISLPRLIERYGTVFAGKYHGKDFPLLLKLIDADSALSVQVHPDDAYAAANENGKLGKTEAWLILQAEEGAELVYGVNEGTTAESLAEACEKGPEVSKLLRRVKVKPGDVCFIPAGCVHAIGKGITLYEIQQSSDITYRFYDWDRVDAKGYKRPLHIRKALDVVDLACNLSPVHAQGTGVERVLDERFFTLDMICADDSPELPPIQDFGMVTALDACLTVSWKGGSLTLNKGETCYVPCAAPKLSVSGSGHAALSMPK